ncbi:hypothetical protein HanHA89_Chr04g0171621 [Helianthus annuus]|nr:hypothetical protein HanHA89_Chr04g0171621 [Helianthus annuus]
MFTFYLCDNNVGITDEDFIIHRFHVKKLQACFPPGTDLSKGTPKIIDKASCVDVNGEVIIDEPAGKSYRWEYTFKSKLYYLSVFSNQTWLFDVAIIGFYIVLIVCDLNFNCSLT